MNPAPFIIVPEMITKAAVDQLEHDIRAIDPRLKIDRSELDGLKIYVLDPDTLANTIACQPHTSERDGYIKTAAEVVRQLRNAK